MKTLILYLILTSSALAQPSQTTYINQVNSSGVYDYSKTMVVHTNANGSTSVQQVNGSGVQSGNTYWLHAPNIRLSTPPYHFIPPAK